jgi:hypothetical protein
MATKRKRQPFSAGDVFLVPLSDGSSSVGQVLSITPRAMNSCICAFFDVRISPNAKGDIPLADEKLIAVQFVTPESLASGLWPVIDNRRLAIDIESHIPLNALSSTGSSAQR